MKQWEKNVISEAKSKEFKQKILFIKGKQNREKKTNLRLRKSAGIFCKKRNGGKTKRTKNRNFVKKASFGKSSF